MNIMLKMKNEIMLNKYGIITCTELREIYKKIVKENK